MNIYKITTLLLLSTLFIEGAFLIIQNAPSYNLGAVSIPQKQFYDITEKMQEINAEKFFICDIKDNKCVVVNSLK
jgi:hypothetical protein